MFVHVPPPYARKACVHCDPWVEYVLELLVTVSARRLDDISANHGVSFLETPDLLNAFVSPVSLLVQLNGLLFSPVQPLLGTSELLHEILGLHLGSTYPVDVKNQITVRYTVESAYQEVLDALLIQESAGFVFKGVDGDLVGGII